MRIIPAIDIIDGQCVRLSQGDFDTRKVYYKDPLDAALSFEQAGLQFLHLVDLDGARQRQVQNWDVLERLTTETNLHIDFSGGISSLEDVERAFETGAKQVAIGSLAVKEPDMVRSWISDFGAEQIIIGADVVDGFIATHGWQEKSVLSLINFIEDYTIHGGSYFLCTDVSKDGKLQGPSLDLYKEVLNEFPNIKLIASGGVSSLQDIHDLAAIACESVIVGKAIYEGRFTLEELVNTSIEVG